MPIARVVKLFTAKSEFNQQKPSFMGAHAGRSIKLGHETMQCFTIYLFLAPFTLFFYSVNSFDIVLVDRGKKLTGDKPSQNEFLQRRDCFYNLFTV